MAIPFMDNFVLIKSFISNFTGSGNPDGSNNQVDPVTDEEDPAQWCAPHWDCFIDCVNRSMRPMMCLGVFGMFVFAWAWTAHFLLFAAALKALPEMVWYITLTIVGGWMASRFRSGGGNNNSNVMPPLPAPDCTLQPDPVPDAPPVDTSPADVPPPPPEAPAFVSNQADLVADNHPCLDGPIMPNATIDAWKNHAH